MSAPRRSSAVLALLIVGAGVLVTLAYFLLQRSRQPREGQVEVAGLEAPVEVTFDRWAIPRIAGGSERDVLFAQGFVHASERLWQLELFQRIARGRLAEVFGETALPTDRLMRTLDLWTAAGRELETLDASDRVSLEAYASGVNARVASWSGPWPPEFLILGIEPQPWSPRASLAIGRIMALDLSGWRNELTRTSVTSRLDANRRAVLAPGYPAWGPTILQDEAAEGEAEGAVLHLAAGAAGAIDAAPIAGDDWPDLSLL
ncbi:MAG: penicillin acylase family protein [Gemmatimonadota bacterium]|nr:penicillin acylase family protein [Gemmatimonadota bacterium]